MRKNFEIYFTPQELSSLQAGIDQMNVVLRAREISLDSSERRGLTVMGNSSRPFVADALKHAEQNPEFAAGVVDAIEMRRNLETYDAVKPLFQAVQKMHRRLQDTLYLSGNDAFQAARGFYHMVKWSKDESYSEAIPIYTELSKKFARANSSGIGIDEEGVGRRSASNTDSTNGNSTPPTSKDDDDSNMYDDLNSPFGDDDPTTPVLK